MKTPKRYQDKPTPMMPEDSEPDWYVLYQWCQRAKRKNKYRQLKRTITKLKAENENLVRLLALKVIEDMDDADRKAFEWCLKRITVDTFTPTLKMEDNLLIKHCRRPVIKWDNKEIEMP